MQRIFLIVFAFIIEILLFHDSEQAPQHVGTNYQIRCTRRYTPGICGMPMAVVWTFVFQIQNCSERLGCPTASRTNRFNNYRHCMRRCRPLADLYSQVLAVGSKNKTDRDLRTSVWGRRDGIAVNSEDLESFRQQESEPEYDARFADLPLVNPFGDGEAEVGQEDVTPPDIDHVESDHVPNPYDLFHDAFGTN